MHGSPKPTPTSASPPPMAWRRSTSICGAAGVEATSNADKIELALELERRVRRADERITGVRIASYGDNASVFALASTAGIEASTRATSASVSVQALAAEGERTQTGYAYDGAREPDDLDLDKVVGRAVSHTVDLLGSTKPKTTTVDLVLDPHLSATVLGLIAGTMTGDRVAEGALAVRGPHRRDGGGRIPDLRRRSDRSVIAGGRLPRR